MSDAHTIGQPPQLDVLGRIALFLDFDGTLVPIADEPGAIAVPDDLTHRLETYAASLEGRLAVVSGRSLADLQAFLGEAALFRAGSHGSDIVGPDGEVLLQAETVPGAAKDALRGYAETNGLYFEDKPHGAGLHSRKNPAQFADMVAFGKSVAQDHALACKVGKQVIELVPPGTGKDGAVRTLMQQPPFVGALPVFIGDDVTDEDGFLACEAAGGFGIAVGERRSEHARYRLDGVSEVYEWLKL